MNTYVDAYIRAHYMHVHISCIRLCILCMNLCWVWSQVTGPLHRLPHASPNRKNFTTIQLPHTRQTQVPKQHTISSCPNGPAIWAFHLPYTQEEPSPEHVVSGCLPSQGMSYLTRGVDLDHPRTNTWILFTWKSIIPLTGENEKGIDAWSQTRCKWDHSIPYVWNTRKAPT